MLAVSINSGSPTEVGTSLLVIALPENPTIAGIAATLEQLTCNPQQWDALRANPALAAAAFAEALRHASPAQLMFRTTRPGGASLGGHELEGDVKIAAFMRILSGCHLAAFAAGMPSAR